MSDTEDPDRLLSRRQVHQTFGLSVRYLEVAAMRGEGPPMVRIGRCVRYRVADVRRWIASHRHPCTGERETVR